MAHLLHNVLAWKLLVHEGDLVAEGGQVEGSEDAGSLGLLNTLGGQMMVACAERV